MLDPWIIEEILKKEEERRREQERGHVELPVDSYRDSEHPRAPSQPQRDDQDRGVAIIDI
ncbi:MAG TPA: hypothetical protein VLX92_13120 [Kofleriaceae bacterium]|nr:hypothetical protein [Kofleriaceae bacterium]